MNRIMIDPIGGGENYGMEYNGRFEKDDSIKFSNLLCDRLENECGISTTLTRYMDMDITIKERVETIKFVNPDLLISIRRNSKNGLGYYASPNSIASNIMQLLKLKINNMYKDIYMDDSHTSKLFTTGCPVIALFINNIKSEKENEEFEKTYKLLINQIIDVINLLTKNSPETIKNIINAIKTNDVVLGDDEGYFVVGPHPGYNESIIYRGKSLNKAIEICNKHVNVHVYRDNDPNAKSLHKSNLKRFQPISYTQPITKYQTGYIISKNGCRSFKEKNTKSKCVTTYNHNTTIKVFAEKCDAEWVYVVDTINGNGFIPRKCTSI